MGKLLTTAALAEKLGVSPRRALQLLRKITPIRKLGAAYEVREEDLRLLVERKTQPGPPKNTR